MYGESARELTTTELEVLKEAGSDVDEHAELSDPMIEYVTEFAAILKTSLSTTQAATSPRRYATEERLTSISLRSRRIR